jgi:sec-independent protein translocase protein TatB
MFDIGWGELLVVGIVALIAIGPKELPTVMRSLGHWMGKIRRMASEFQGQFQEALREAEMDDLKKQADELTSAVTDATKFDPLADIDNDGGADTHIDTDTDFETAEPEQFTPDDSEPEPSEPATTEASAETGEAPQPASSEPEILPDADVQPPQPPQPVTEQDLAPAEPPPKQAGGKA